MENLSFSKVTTVGSTGLITGRIYFETSTGCIKVAKSDKKVDVFGAGVKSASWDEGSQKLTIVNQNNEQIEVDFSDIASADSVTAELAKKLNIGTSADASTVQSYYGLKKYTDEAKSFCYFKCKFLYRWKNWRNSSSYCIYKAMVLQLHKVVQVK